MTAVRPQQRQQLHRRDRRRAVAGEAGQRVQAGRHLTAPDRHPRRSWRARRPTCITCGCRGCCTGGSCARAARWSTGSALRSSRSTRARSSTSRASRIVRKGDFLGVVAPLEYDAIQAAAQLKVVWADPPAVLPGSGNEFKGDAGARQRRQVRADRRPWSGNVDAALGSAARVVVAELRLAHDQSLPDRSEATVADVTPQGARILTWTQDVYKTRDAVAPVIGLPANRVRVTHFAGGGTNGYNQYIDVAQAAALMSQLAGAPVRLQLMRWDEIGWDQTRARFALRHPCRRRCQRQDRRLRLHAVLPAVQRRKEPDDCRAGGDPDDRPVVGRRNRGRSQRCTTSPTRATC